MKVSSSVRVAAAVNLAAFLTLTSCGGPPPSGGGKGVTEVEIPLQVTQSAEQGAPICKAAFVDSKQKVLRQKPKQTVLAWVLKGPCPQAQIVPTGFVLKAPDQGKGESDEELCRQGNPVDDFDVTATGRRATAKLKPHVQDGHPEGTTRYYCYTLLLRAPDQPDQPVDPEIEYIWP